MFRRVLCSAVLATLAASLPAAAQQPPLQAAQQQALSALERQMPALEVTWRSTLEIPRQLTGLSSDRLALEPQAIRSAFAGSLARLYRIDDPESEIRTGQVITDAKGFSRLSLYQRYRDVPVYGSELKLTLAPDRRLRTVSGKWLPDVELDTTPALDREQAMARILDFMRQTHAGPDPLPEDLRLEPDRFRLVVFDPGVYSDSPGVQHLAYHVHVRFQVFFVDAHSGEILYTYSNVQTAKDRETYNTTSCFLLPGTLILDEGGAVGGPPDAETQNCHDFKSETYDYFFDTHGRDGHTGSGDTMISTVHSGIPFWILCLEPNAAYLPDLDQWVYSDGGDLGDGKSFTALANGRDVVAHEIAHGVTWYSVFDDDGDPVGLDYTDQSGALNESFSDVIGAMVDREDWLMGEDVTVGFACGALRDMADPPACDQPDHMDNYDSSEGVHHNSGIPNKVAYLMAEGGVHPYSSIAVAGIGREDTEQLLYRTLTHHLTRTATFLEARAGTLLAAMELFPGDVDRFATVWNAFVACGICDPLIPDDCDPFTLEPRDPVDIVLALDYSSSMNSAAEPGGSDKIDVLKGAAEIFLRTWEIFAMPDDRADVVFFDSDVSPLAISLETLDADTLITEIQNRPTGGFTAMGGAAQVALTGLSSGASHPAILLFTNGIQNVNPMAVDVCGHHEIVKDAGAWGGTSSVAPQPGVAIGDYDVPIHIIGIGEAAATSYHTLLDAIRLETGGLLHLTTSPDTDLVRFYLEQLVAALNLGTLEMVGYRHGTTSTDPAAGQTFEVDGSVTRAAFVVHWRKGPGVVPPQIRIFGPGNVALTPTRWVPAAASPGDHYRTAVFDFPYVVNGQRVDPAGNWRILVSPPAGTPAALSYQAALLVDETEVHYDFALPERVLWTGDPIPVSARVTVSGLPVPLQSARAEVTYPRTALGTFIATDGTLQRGPSRTAPPNEPPTDLLSTPTQAKLIRLLESPLLRPLLQPLERTLDLSAQGGGTYGASLDATELPGLYRFEISVAGSTPRGEPIARTQTLSTIVRVKPDPGATETVAEWTAQRQDGSGSVRVTVIPFDAFGNFLGPGHGDSFEATATGASFEGPVGDPLDGSYELHFEVPDRSRDPELAIAVLGFEVYRGPLSEILTPAERFGLSLHAGLAYPHDELDRFLDQDLAFALDFEVVLGHRLSLEAVLGRATLDSRSGDLAIDHLSANLKYFSSVRRVRGFVNGGAGAYKIEGDSSIFLGVSAGGGVSWQIRPRVYLDTGYNYHLIFADGVDLDLSTVMTGLRWRF